jgi:predicted nucleic acid-binding protein
VIVLIDTDVLIDVALDRRPFSAPAGHLLDALQDRRGKGYVAWHSISNFYYMVSPKKGSPGAKDFIRDLLRFTDVSPAGTRDVLYAVGLRMADFEDALQCAAAVACEAEVIATRNFRDYRNSPVPARNPQAVLTAITR